MESIVRNEIVLYMRQNQIFSPRQFGFISGSSTTLQLLHVLEEWMKALDEGEEIDVIYADFQKPSISFSSVEYKPDSAHLDSPLHGSTPILKGAVNLFILAVPRPQFPVTLCTTGVLQGSVLGPMFFSLFISNIAHIVSSYGLLKQQYADDTQLYVIISKDNYDTPVVKLELCLLTLYTWLCYNELALKPEAIVFGTTQHSRSLPFTSTVNVAKSLVQVFNQARILGVTLDSRLSFDAHISALENPIFITSVHSATSVPTSH